ncbi:hypothetical protein BD560DRAFT_467629 [Blakeslea trispora]|nr:hypothetical protein BD560DRAFT_467629 [Blakeslea trispora]
MESRQKADERQAKGRQKAARKAKSVITKWQQFLEFQAFKNQKNPSKMTIEMHHSTSSYSQIQLRVSKFLEKIQNYVTNPKKKRMLYLKLSNNLHEAIKKTCLHGESYSIKCCLGMGKLICSSDVLFCNRDAASGVFR